MTCGSPALLVADESKTYKGTVLDLPGAVVPGVGGIAALDPNLSIAERAAGWLLDSGLEGPLTEERVQRLDMTLADCKQLRQLAEALALRDADGSRCRP
eukprot:scaffold21.g2076.t1